MTKERSVFSNDLCKSMNLSSFRNIIFKEDTCLCLSFILQSFNLDMLRDKDIDSNNFSERWNEPLKMVCSKYPLKVVLEYFNNCQALIKVETKSLKILLEEDHFSKVWSLQPVILLLAYIFIENKLLQSLFPWKPFKNFEKCFLFHLKSSFRSQDIEIFVLTFWSCRRSGLFRKIRFITKFLTSQPG